MYRREYQLAQPDCHSRGRPPYQYVDQEAVAEPLSHRTQPINAFNWIDTAFCGHCQQLSKVSHAKICLAIADNNVVGVEAELLRIALAKSQFDSADGMLWSIVLPELQNMFTCNYMVKKFVRPQSTLMLINNAASSETTEKGAEAKVSAVRLVGGSVRSIQVPRLARSRPRWGLQQLEDNEAIIDRNASPASFAAQPDIRLLHCTKLQAKLPDQAQTSAKQ